MSLKFIPSKLSPTFHLEGSIPPEVLAVEDELVRSKGDITYSLNGFMTEEFIEITGEIATTFLYRCGRCGEWMPGEIKKSDFQAVFDAPFPESVDLTPQIREDILIDLPFAPTCQLDGEYRCPITGETHPPTPEKAKKSLGNEEVWKALEQLKPKE
ncbi:MAG: hypothetical protein V4507_04810 [Verrucomicrobiota bacterium]